VLRLLPYQPDLNRNEFIWADLKEWVKSKYMTFKIKDIKRLCRQRFKEIGQEEWDNVCQQVEKVEHYYEKEGIIKDATEHIIIEDNEVESSDSSNESIDTSESKGMSGVEELEED
jgi:hypothetical protein